MLRLTVSRPVCLGVRHPFGTPLPDFFAAIYGFVEVEHPL
jgi:hypothetical protein